MTSVTDSGSRRPEPAARKLQPYEPGEDGFRVLLKLGTQPEPDFAKRPTSVAARVRARWWFFGFSVGAGPDVGFHASTGAPHLLPGALPYATGEAFKRSSWADRSVAKAEARFEERNKRLVARGKAPRVLSPEIPRRLIAVRSLIAAYKLRTSHDFGRFATGFMGFFIYFHTMAAFIAGVRLAYSAAVVALPFLGLGPIAAGLHFMSAGFYGVCVALGAAKALLPRAIDRWPGLHHMFEGVEDRFRSLASKFRRFHERGLWIVDENGRRMPMEVFRKDSPLVRDAPNLDGIEEPHHDVPRKHPSIRRAMFEIECAVGSKPSFFDKSYAPFLRAALVIKKAFRVGEDGRLVPIAEIGAEERLGVGLHSLQRTIQIERNDRSFTLESRGFGTTVRRAMATMDSEPYHAARAAESDRVRTLAGLECFRVGRNPWARLAVRMAAASATAVVIGNVASSVAAGSLASGRGASVHSDDRGLSPLEQAQVDAQLRVQAERHLALERAAAHEANLDARDRALAALVQERIMPDTPADQTRSFLVTLADGARAAAAVGDADTAYRVGNNLAHFSARTGHGDMATALKVQEYAESYLRGDSVAQRRLQRTASFTPGDSGSLTLGLGPIGHNR